jgi:hypothetical protein
MDFSSSNRRPPNNFLSQYAQHILQSKENILMRAHIQTHTQRIRGRKLPHPNYTKALGEKENYKEVLENLRVH